MQAELFTWNQMRPPPPAVHYPDPEGVRAMFARFIAKMRAADSMPADAGMMRGIFGNHLRPEAKCLSPEEITRLAAEFEAELRRLAATVTCRTLRPGERCSIGRPRKFEGTFGEVYPRMQYRYLDTVKP